MKKNNEMKIKISAAFKVSTPLTAERIYIKSRSKIERQEFLYA